MLTDSEAIILNKSSSTIDIFKLKTKNMVSIAHQFLNINQDYIWLETFLMTSLLCLLERQ
jgi:hypothetical protein